MADRTVQLSPYWAAQAEALLAEINKPPGENIPDVLDRITQILGLAYHVAMQVTRLWDEAGDKQRSGL